MQPLTRGTSPQSACLLLCSNVLRAYKPASFVEQQHKARAAALAAGGTGAGQGPLRQLRLNRLLQEVQVGGLLVWTHSAPSAALLRFALLCLPARRLPGCACADPILLLTCLPACLPGCSCLPMCGPAFPCCRCYATANTLSNLAAASASGASPHLLLSRVLCCCFCLLCGPCCPSYPCPATPVWRCRNRALLPTSLKQHRTACPSRCRRRQLPTPPGTLRLLCHLALDEPPEDDSSNGCGTRAALPATDTSSDKT